MTRNTSAFLLIRTLLALGVVIGSFFVTAPVTAQVSSNIDAEGAGNKYAQFLNSDFGAINFNPTNGGVFVDGSSVSGYAWGEHVGWINLSPSGAGVGQSPTNSGNLTGYAWGETTGWINFDPTNAVSVSIDGSGFFSGYAWSENFGWIQFDCSTQGVGSSGSCVRTSWRPPLGGGDDDDDDGGPGDDDDDGEECPEGFICTPTGDDDDDDGGPGGDDDDDGEPGDDDDDDGEPGDDDDDEQPGDDDDDDGTPGDDDDDDGFTGPGGGGAPDPCLFGTSGSQLCNITRGVDLTLDSIVDILKTPAGRTIAKIISTIGVVVSAVASLGSLLFLNPLSLSEIILIPIRLWSLLLSALGLKKRRRPWGTVYDSITKQPLDPAYVILQDINGEEIETSITDLDGRYGFLVSPGQYRIVAHKTHYQFPSQKLATKQRDELYDDLYFGNPITITEEGEVFTKNIPMDPEDFDWNEFEKHERKLMKFHTKQNVWLAKFSGLLFWIGFTVSAIALLVTPEVYNIVIFALYIVVYLIRVFGLRKKSSGYVTDSVTGRPLPFAIIRVFSAQNDTEILHKVADKNGRFYALVSPGRYYVTVERKTGEDDYELAYTSPAKDYTHGHIDTDFEV